MSKIAVGKPQILRSAHSVGEPKAMLLDNIQPVQLVPGEALHPRRQQQTALAITAQQETRLVIGHCGNRSVVRVHIMTETYKLRLITR